MSPGRSLGGEFFAPATVPVDFEASDVPDSCEFCPTWRVESAVDIVGVPVSREWHQPTCPVSLTWADDDTGLPSPPLPSAAC